MNKIKSVRYGLLPLFLSVFVLFSCDIDEEKNLLFQLKDNIVVAGVWQKVGTADKFEFFSDGTFTAKIGIYSGRGTFTYLEVTDDSIFNSHKAKFILNWSKTLNSSFQTKHKQQTVYVYGTSIANLQQFYYNISDASSSTVSKVSGEKEAFVQTS